MDETVPTHRLRKMKTLIFNSFQDHPEEDSVIKSRVGLMPVDGTISGRVNRMFTIKLGSPWDEYDYIRRRGQVMIVRQRASYFRLANIQESTTVNALQQCRILCRITHSNVALSTALIEVSLCQMETTTAKQPPNQDPSYTAVGRQLHRWLPRFFVSVVVPH